MKNISVVIVMATILMFFPDASKAGSKSQAVGKMLGGITSVINGEEADLTREQLRSCLLSKRKMNKQADTIEQVNSKLELLKAEIEKRFSYIEKKRSQTKNLSQKQIKSLNNTITKQKKAITVYNKGIDSLKEKVLSYKKAQKSFNATCTDKSYHESDMQSVIAEIGEEKKAKKNNAKIDSNKAHGKYSLTVNLTPADAKVRIMNIKPKYKHGILLKPGKYDVSVTHPNYQEYRKWIKIKNSNLSIDVVLKK